MSAARCSAVSQPRALNQQNLLHNVIPTSDWWIKEGQLCVTKSTAYLSRPANRICKCALQLLPCCMSCRDRIGCPSASCQAGPGCPIMSILLVVQQSALDPWFQSRSRISRPELQYCCPECHWLVARQLLWWIVSGAETGLTHNQECHTSVNTNHNNKPNIGDEFS